MADTIKTVKENTKKLLKMAADELGDNVHFFRESEKVEKSAFKNDSTGHMPGDTVSVRLPTHWGTQSDNFDLTSTGIQDAKERAVDLTLDMSETIAFDLDTTQLATEIDLGSVYDRFVKPAVMDMSAKIESRFLTKATQYVGNTVGSAGSTVFDPRTIMNARARLSQYLVSPKSRDVCFLIDALAMADATDANKNLFTFSDKEKELGALRDSWGTKWYQNELIYNHTNGNDVTGVAVENSVVTIANGMATLGIDGLTNDTGTLTKGTVFTIDGVYAVHPQTKESLGFLKQFTHVGTSVTANSSGQATLTLNQPIYDSTDTRQNVSALPADEAGITIVGAASTSYRQTLMWEKKAFRVASVPLVMPTKAELAEQVTEQGITLALIRDWDNIKRRMVTRLDFLGGLVAVRPDHAVRITK